MTTQRTLLRAMIAAATLVLVVGAVVFAAGNNKENPTIAPDGVGVVEVQLGAVSFEPAEIEFPAGTVVRFVNAMDIVHDVVQATPSEIDHKKSHDDDGHGHDDDKLGHEDDGHGPVEVTHGFHSPHLKHQGDSWEVRFTEAGEYPILCTVNNHYKAGMIGKIVVTES